MCVCVCVCVCMYLIKYFLSFLSFCRYYILFRVNACMNARREVITMSLHLVMMFIMDDLSRLVDNDDFRLIDWTEFDDLFLIVRIQFSDQKVRSFKLTFFNRFPQLFVVSIRLHIFDYKNSCFCFACWVFIKLTEFDDIFLIVCIQFSDQKVKEF